MKYGIDYAQESDIPALVGMGVHMHQESSFRDMAYCPKETAQFVEACINVDSLDVIIAVSEGEILGFILCSVVKSFFGPDLTAQEFAFYVDPAARATGVARALLREYIAWARRKGAVRVTVGNSAGAPDEAFVALAESEGFQKTGSITFKDL